MSRRKARAPCGPTAGSNAGRGFRYQDQIGALFITRMYLGESGFEAIIPEGSDDYQIRHPDGDIVVDAKSTRADARTRTDTVDSGTFKKLWSRPLAPGVRVAEYWIVSERSKDAGAGKHPVTVLAKPAPPLAARSFVLVEPDPVNTAAELLVSQRGLTPLAAELVVLAFAQAVGELASANGPLPLALRQAITQSEAERIASRVLSGVDADRLEALIRTGFLRAVDFTTPLEDSGFYQGVDVQPGHFSAGLALERPEEAARVVEALDRMRAAVVRGPSGAGKSGLMWNAVIAARHARRWFRVNPGVVTGPEALTAFFDAYAGVKVGFVIDDVGRGGIEAWNSLRHHSHEHLQVAMIGSVRSEDSVLLPARHTIAEIDVVADPSLAQALWAKLRDRGQTTWSGWKEAWDLSKGLLLEYGHILTAGARLEAVILDQVRARLTQRRDSELAVLRASALAAAHGGTVQIEALRQRLELSAGDVARALERLLQEHLVRLDGAGSTLSGLHALRANAISRAVAEVGFATLEAQACDALAVVEDTSLETVTAGCVANGAISAEAAAVSLAARFSRTVGLPEMAAAVRGLRIGEETLAVRKWLATLAAAGVARKLATTSAMMGMAPSASLSGIEALTKAAELGGQFQVALAAQRVPEVLASALIEGLRRSAQYANTIDRVEALSALAKAPLAAKHRVDLTGLPLMFDDVPIEEVVSILDAAEAIDPAIAAAWVGVKDLLARLSAETPFALAITREVTEEGLVVHGDVFEAALAPGENQNERLVRHVHSIMRLEPRATLAHVRLVGMLGEKSLHPDAEKRIARENAPPRALAQSNRRVIDVVAAQVAGPSWSHYLATGSELLRKGLRAFERLIDSVIIGPTDSRALDDLNEAVGACDDLLAPIEPPRAGLEGKSEHSGRHLTSLQNVIFSTNAPLIKRIVELPNGAGAIAGFVEDLIVQVDQAKEEPWALVRDGPPRDLDRMKLLLRRIEVVAMESQASDLDPRKRWRKPDGKPKDALSFLAMRSRRALEDRIEACRERLLALLATVLPGVTLMAATPDDGIGWPSMFIAIFPIDSFATFERWNDEAHETGERLRAQMQYPEDITLIPLLNGVAAVNYAYQLSHGESSSIVREMLLAAGQTRLLAKPDRSVLSRIGVPILDHPVELERVCSALAESIGLVVLGLGGPDRPESERECVERALTTIHADGPRLLDRFEFSDSPAIVTLRSWVHTILSGEDVASLKLALSPMQMQDALVEWTWRQSLAPG